VDLTPYVRLPSKRSIAIDWLPQDLCDFYASHEGVGLESSSDRPVRICRLDEVTTVMMHDLHLFDDFPLEGGWADFSAIRIGTGCFFDELVYITQAPVCPPGSIMAFGVDVAGPGGEGGDDDPWGSLVLARDFGEWISRLRADGWDELGLVPGELQRLSADRAQCLRRRFAELNPRAGWLRA
jgi:hypothetical protein